MPRVAAWALIGAILTAIYGTEVCPVLERVGASPMLPAALVLFLGTSIVSVLLGPRLLAGPHEQQVRRTYLLTLLQFALVGLALALWDHQVHHVPWHNGFKVAVGATMVGHFAGVDLALHREHELLLAGSGGSGGTTVPAARSLVRRLTSIAVVTVLLVVSTSAFMVLRDLDVLASGDSPDVHRSVMIELGAVAAVVIGLALNLILHFARNVGVLFEHQTRALRGVADGELGVGVPVITEDEFGVIAAHTNRMIEGLRERQKIREALGKVVSPDVARELLEGKDGLSLGGSRRTLTMLFSDIRGFTSWSEGTSPEALVRDLNRYFTEMVRIVHEEGGVVDKFIGDGMMAVFGLSHAEDAAIAATRAARRMTESVAALAFERPLRIGIGIHRGDVIAGNIGSPDRLEYTFIGDAVNTAARVESLSAKLDQSALITRSVFDQLPPEERARWRQAGAHGLKGKAEPVEVYRLVA